MTFYKQNIMVPAAFLLIALAFFGLEAVTDGASLLYTMLFFVAITQGPIAVIAATELAMSNWAKPYKRAMLSVRHMIPMISILFAVFAFTGKIDDLYLWTGYGHHKWLDKNFFIARNILMPLIAWVLANKYAKESLSDSGGKVKWALFWVFAYVIGQTIVAVDWVMSLEFPWISTLFGAYFFVEAFYIGLAFAAMFTAFRFHDFHETFGEKVFKKTQMDMMTMFFGFSIFWAYQFFSQFLVIWYGNIPEEVAYITKRQEVFGNPMLFSVIIILFLIPFWVLMSRKFKANPQVIRAIGLLVCLGIFLERFIMIGTYPHFSVNLGVALVEIAVMAALFVFVVRSDTKTLTAG